MALIDRLACPRCDAALREAPGGAPREAPGAALRCDGCHVDFPRLGGLPWLFAEPAAALGEWRGRWRFALSQLRQDVERLAESLRDEYASATTRARLERLHEATKDHAHRLAAVLAPLDVESATAAHETYLALRTRPPQDQGLTTYYTNLHRDWAWGDEENAASLECVTGGASAALGERRLVLGAGAGRLAYDLHAAAGAGSTVALDFNPLLALVADRVAHGDTVELYEFPIAPRSSGDAAVLRALAAPDPAPPGLEFVLADAHRPPFAPGSFDTIVTPWLVDILPERFETLCARINALLADGGRWINFGSLSFHSPDPALRYGVEECVEAIAAAGFAEPEVEERAIPYMCSPASRHARRETVVTWRARKARAVKRPPRHEALPEWLVRGKDPVPMLDAFRMQAMSTRIHAFIMSLVDGRRSLHDIAGVLAEQQLMTRDEAEPAIRAFLIKMYEDSRRPGLY